MDIDSKFQLQILSFDDPRLSSLIRGLHDNYSAEKVVELLWIDKNCSWWIYVDGKKEEVKFDVINCYQEDGSGIGEILRKLCLEPVLRSGTHFKDANKTETPQSIIGLWLMLWFAIHVASEHAMIGSLAAGQALKRKWLKKPQRSGIPEGEEGRALFDSINSMHLAEQPVSIILNRLSNHMDDKEFMKVSKEVLLTDPPDNIDYQDEGYLSFKNKLIGNLYALTKSGEEDLIRLSKLLKDTDKKSNEFRLLKLESLMILHQVCDAGMIKVYKQLKYSYLKDRKTRALFLLMWTKNAWLYHTVPGLGSFKLFQDFLFTDKSFFAYFYIKHILGQEVYHGKSLETLYPGINLEAAWKTYLSNYLWIRLQKREQDKIAKRRERLRKSESLIHEEDEPDKAFDKIQFEKYEKKHSNVEKNENIEILLSILPDRQKQAFKLKLEGYKQFEIAKKMEISAPAVHYLLRKVKEKHKSINLD